MIRCAAPAVMQAYSSFEKNSFEKTAPVLNLVLNFQILENPDLKYLNHILEKKITGPPVHATTALLLHGCQDNSCEQPNRGAVACANDARQAVLVEPLPPGLTTRAIGLSVPMDSGSGLVSVQPLFELSRSKCGVGCAIRASESGLDVL